MMDDASGIADNLAREQLGGSAFQHLLGYRLVEWSVDYARVVYTIQPAHLNRSGILHGGVMAAVLDAAAGFCGVFSETSGETRSAVTLAFNIQFLANAASGATETIARRTGGGRKTFFATAEMRHEDGRLMAAGTGVFRYITRSSVS